jgi:hypothetical protein
MCTEHTFSQQSVKAQDFSKAFPVAFYHYKQSGALDAVRDRLKTMLEGKAGQRVVVEQIRTVLKENRLCMCSVIIQ